MTRDEQIEIIRRDATGALKDEIDYQMKDVDREADDDDVPPYDEVDALDDTLDRCEWNKDAPILLRQCREMAIKLGWYRAVSEDELARTFVTRGKKYDFKLDGVKYKFTSAGAAQRAL